MAFRILFLSSNALSNMRIKFFKISQNFKIFRKLRNLEKILAVLIIFTEIYF